MTSSSSAHRDRRDDIEKLKSSTFDVVIVGGGISGAWLALHCSQQGFKTALIEKKDYASQTSSSSSKLLHSGMRYMQQFEFNKVRESALERAEYLYAAPHLSNAVPFIVPTYRSFQKSKFFLNSGMLVYKALCVGENKVIGSKEEQLPPITSISAEKLNNICDLSDHDHTGGVMLYERQMHDSERTVLAILQTARDAGAIVINHFSAQDFILEEDRVAGLNCRDELANADVDITAKLVVNAAGPWIDSLNAKLKKSQYAPKVTGYSVGSHIITRQLSSHAIAVTTKHQSNAKIDRGGRHIFIIPWRGHSLIGTSHSELDSVGSDLVIEADHVNQLLEAVNDGIPSAKLKREELISGYSGIYLLQTENIQKTVYQGSGEYQIIDHAAANGIEGLVTCLGAKFTTGRKLSAVSMKLISSKLGSTGNDVARTKLKNADYNSLSAFIKDKQEQYQEILRANTIKHLVLQYGSEIDAFIARIEKDASLLEKICPHLDDLMGQVVWAVENEQTFTLNDMLFNRSSVGLLGIKEEEVSKVALIMAKHLAWSESQLMEQENTVVARLKRTKAALLNSDEQG